MFTKDIGYYYNNHCYISLLFLCNKQLQRYKNYVFQNMADNIIYWGEPERVSSRIIGRVVSWCAECEQ